MLSYIYIYIYIFFFFFLQRGILDVYLKTMSPLALNEDFELSFFLSFFVHDLCVIVPLIILMFKWSLWID